MGNIKTANVPQTSGTATPGVARSPESRPSGDDEGTTPPDNRSGPDAANGQKGEPGLPDAENKEWSPGSDQEK